MNYSSPVFLTRLFIILLSAFMLASCSDEDVDDLCVNPLVTTSSPDLTSSPYYTDISASEVSISTIGAGQTLRIKIPVDAETRSVVAGFAAIGSTSLVGTPLYVNASDRIIDGTAETISVEISSPGTPGLYYPMIVACVDTAEAVLADVSKCGTSIGQSVGFVEDRSNLITTSNFAKVIVLTNPFLTPPYFLDPAVDSTGALNTCVTINPLTVT